MIQFNLLPDVKLEYIKSNRLKRSVIMLAVIISGVSIGIFILLFLMVNLLQKQQIKNQTKDIKNYSEQLENTPDLNKILTVQNQLLSLPELHDKKVVAARLFPYLTQVTPAKASISRLNVDFTANTMTITGTADSLNTVNKFVDTLKFTNFKTTTDSSDKKAFSEVVLQTFSRDDKSASYQINLKYDPTIFYGADEVTLTVPKIITTRSETEKPDALFQNTSNNKN